MSNEIASQQAPCYPTRQLKACGSCQRKRNGVGPKGYRSERIVIIDASIYARDGSCEMYEPFVDLREKEPA